MRDPAEPGIEILALIPEPARIGDLRRRAPEGRPRLNRQLLRRGRRLEAIFRLGGLRSIFELIEELIRHGLIAEAEIEWRLAAYAELDPRALKITGGDRLTPLPIRPIGGR